jgi:hypothetical protein
MCWPAVIKLTGFCKKSWLLFSWLAVFRLAGWLLLGFLASLLHMAFLAAGCLFLLVGY